MMTFEDIVDMDWLDSHSVKGEPMELFPNSDYVDFNHYLSNDLLSSKAECVSSPPPLLMASPPPSGLMSPTAAISCSAAAALAAAATTPPPPLTFPTTEQIKQLIELAKHQLALRTSQTSIDNSNATCSSGSTDNQVIKSEPPSSTDTTAVSESPASPSSHLAVHLANTNLFVNNTTFPDTVSPEYLMKPTPTQPMIKTEQDGTVPCLSRSASPPSLIPDAMDTNESSKTKKSMTLSNHTANSRRDSLLGDDIGSLEAYAESDGIDIKKLTPKERRQLRNKISARNFRVRRKEYITTLEQQVNDHKQHADSLAEQLGRVEDENKQLRQQVDTLKRQNLLLQQQQQ